MEQKELIIYTDGGARGNPGPAGIGAVIYDRTMNPLAKISEYIGVATNNQAEYRAVLAAIKKAKEFSPEIIRFFLDSKLAAEQLSGRYKIKNQGLQALFVLVYNESIGFKQVSYTHIPREKNKEADLLANLAMDRGGLVADV